MSVTSDGVVSSIASMSQGRVRALAQFNIHSGAFIGVISWVNPETLDNNYYEYREIEYDFVNDIVEGDVTNFKVIDRKDMPLIFTEESLDIGAQEKITKKYPLVKQVNLLSNLLEALVSKLDNSIVDDPEVSPHVLALREMRDYIQTVKDANNERKRMFEESEDVKYISNADKKKAIEGQLEGGLHEALGARILVGGSVFG